MGVPELGSAMSLILADVLTKYSPDQLRDDHGRWTLNGGGASAPAAHDAVNQTDDDAPADDEAGEPSNPLLHETAWTPPVSRSPYPLRPRPPAPRFNFPGPTINNILAEGAPRDAIGAVEHDIDEIGMGMLARSFAGRYSAEVSSSKYIYSDGDMHRTLLPRS
jgi:hypothetical protein